MRCIYEIAYDVSQDWKRPYFGAIPYLRAMLRLRDADSMYGQDDAQSIVCYFLANAGTWRGPNARRIKAELKEVIDWKGEE